MSTGEKCGVLVILRGYLGAEGVLVKLRVTGETRVTLSITETGVLVLWVLVKRGDSGYN